MEGVEIREDPWWDSQRIDLGHHGLLRRVDIYPLLNTKLDEAVMIWQDFRKFGLPHGKGPANETEEYITLIRAFEAEYNRAESDRIKQTQKTGKK